MSEGLGVTLALPCVHRQMGLRPGLGLSTRLHTRGGHCTPGCRGWHFTRVHKWGGRSSSHKLSEGRAGTRRLFQAEAHGCVSSPEEPALLRA